MMGTDSGVETNTVILIYLFLASVIHAALFVTGSSCAYVRSNGIHPSADPIVAL